jgi:hypothetical protein
VSGGPGLDEIFSRDGQEDVVDGGSTGRASGATAASTT